VATQGRVPTGRTAGATLAALRGVLSRLRWWVVVLNLALLTPPTGEAGAHQGAARAKPGPRGRARPARPPRPRAPRELVLELDWIHHQHPEATAATTIRDRRR